MTNTRTARPFERAIVLIVVVAGGVIDVGCAECADDFDCVTGQACSVDGACVARAGDAVRFANVEDGADVDGVFDVVVHAHFRGRTATVRLDAQNGDPCLPFVPVETVVVGNADEFVDVDVPFDAVFAANDTFTLRATLDVNGDVQTEDVVLHGPAKDDVGGFTIDVRTPSTIDVIASPWLVLAGRADGEAEVYVEPLGGGALSPRLALGSGQVTRAVPLLRGPHIIWVETQVGDRVLRCGSGVRGDPAGDDGGALEFTVLTDAPAWLEVSLHLVGDHGGVCDGSQFIDACRATARASELQALNHDSIGVVGFSGVIEVAAVPAASSEPVDAWVRVTRAGRHEALFGPITVFASEAQSWVAGRVTVENGVVVGAVPVDEFVTGAPW